CDARRRFGLRSRFVVSLHDGNGGRLRFLARGRRRVADGRCLRFRLRRLDSLHVSRDRFRRCFCR
ncbi:TPA: hypothetical protein ACT5B9_007295, partial [Burkholderia cenocepacia]